MGYTHLSITERYKLGVYLSLGWSNRKIGKELGRHHSTIARERKRGSISETYVAEEAHDSYLERRVSCKPRGRFTPELAHELNAQLQQTWSPEQIAEKRRVSGETLPKSMLGQAIAYSLNQWEKLTGYLVDGRLEIDNNPSERSIKPFVIGRKNWLFANTPRGAKASAAIYSVIQRAKENGLHPYNYLKYLFEQLPQITDQLDADALESFTPWSDTLPASCHLITG